MCGAKGPLEGFTFSICVCLHIATVAMLHYRALMGQAVVQYIGVRPSLIPGSTPHHWV